MLLFGFNYRLIRKICLLIVAGLKDQLNVGFFMRDVLCGKNATNNIQIIFIHFNSGYRDVRRHQASEYVYMLKLLKLIYTQE